MNSSNLPTFVSLLVIGLCFLYSPSALPTGAPAMTLTLQSADFTHQGEIPQQFTCDGDDISPSLTWTAAPQNAKTLVLIVDDPDAPDPKAPKMTWVHWLLYNIPITATGLPKGVLQTELPPATLPGKNDWHALAMVALVHL